MKAARPTLLWLALAISAPAPAQTAPSRLRTELKLESAHFGNRHDSTDAALGERDRHRQSLKLRLMWTHAFGNSGWGLDSAYRLEAADGGEVRLERRQQAGYPALYQDPQARNWWSLSHVISDHGAHRVVHRVDRLALTYAGRHLVLRLGRQALTWGNGLVFRPMDLFNPFAPNATDTEYKPGADMIYGQWLFDDGSDLQAVIVPRRNAVDRRLASDSSSAGLKWHRQLGSTQPLDLDLMLARDAGADVLGIGLGGALGGASWNTELVPTRLAGGGVRSSLLANLQYAWSWHGRSISGYVEYFRNGFGVGDRRALTRLPAPLVQRIARGELFTTSRHYLAFGGELQWTPLLTLRPALIGNLDDGSTLVTAQGAYSLTQDLTLTAGLQWPFGGRGSEYGGRSATPAGAPFATPARMLYARLTWYLP